MSTQLAAAPAAIDPALLQTSAIRIAPPQIIPIDRLVESPRNPRQYFPEAKQRELEESMRSGGFRPWMALVACPIDDSEDFEVLAGNRRLRCATAVGLPALPVFVRVGLTDEEKLDILNFDNSGREDVHPLDEAAGWNEWMRVTGNGVADIAARIGQSKEYVYQRLKYASLIDDARTAFLDGHITAGHAILIARLEPPAQTKALKFALQADWRGVRPTVRELAKSLERDLYVDLEGCAFERSDRSLLAGAGDCDACPKRAANIPGFEFDPDDQPAPDLCTDAACYKQKTTNHLVRIRTDLEAKGKTVLSVNSGYGKSGKGVLKKDQYEIVKAAEKGTETALVVDGPDIGKVIHVRVRKEPSAGSAVARQQREQAAREKAAAAKQVELDVRRRILRAVLDKVTAIDLIALRAVLADSFSGRCAAELCRLFGIAAKTWGEGEALQAAMRTMSQAELAKVVAAGAVMDSFNEWTVAEKRSDDSLLDLAKRYKVDPLKIRREAEKELGTPKEVKEAPAAKPGNVPAKRPAAKNAAPKAKPAKKKAAKK